MDRLFSYLGYHKNTKKEEEEERDDERRKLIEQDIRCTFKGCHRVSEENTGDERYCIRHILSERYNL